MRSGLREFGAVVRQAKRLKRNPAGPLSGRPFLLPAFLDEDVESAGAEERAHADAAARAEGWIRQDDHLDRRWAEITDSLGYASAWGFLHVHYADGEDIRAVITVRRGSAFRLEIRGESVTIDEIRPDAPWPALLGCLPDATAAEGEPFVLSRPAWDGAVSAARHFLADQGDGIALSYELRHRGVPAEEASSLGGMIRSRDGHSRLAIALRDAGDVVRNGPTIGVWDTPSGRLAALPGVPDEERTTVAPADEVLLIKTLQEQLDELFGRFGETPDITV